MDISYTNPFMARHYLINQEIRAEMQKIQC